MLSDGGANPFRRARDNGHLVLQFERHTEILNRAVMDDKTHGSQVGWRRWEGLRRRCVTSQNTGFGSGSYTAPSKILKLHEYALCQLSSKKRERPTQRAGIDKGGPIAQCVTPFTQSADNSSATLVPAPPSSNRTWRRIMDTQAGEIECGRHFHCRERRVQVSQCPWTNHR